MFLKLRSRGGSSAPAGPCRPSGGTQTPLTVANRAEASAEAEAVKRRHLPQLLQPVSPAWHIPVKWAASIAARGSQSPGDQPVGEVA